MPLLLGMGLQFGMAFLPPMLMSLMGHLIYSLLTGLVYVAYVRLRPATSGTEASGSNLPRISAGRHRYRGGRRLRSTTLL